MSAATVSQPIARRDGMNYDFALKAAAVKLLKGVLAARNSSGYITNASDAAGLMVVGVHREEVDNSAGSAGDLDAKIETGIFLLSNSVTGPLTDADIGKRCFVEDNQTVASSGGTHGVVAGIVRKVDDSGVWVQVGNLDASVQPFRLPTLVDADGATITAALSGGVISNAGASGAATFALPPATAGLTFTFVVQAAQELRIDPNATETIALPSTGVQGAAGKYLVADAIGEKVQLVCLTAGKWDVIHYSGIWTAEA
jgi:hypothetical protein